MNQKKPTNQNSSGAESSFDRNLREITERYRGLNDIIALFEERFEPAHPLNNVVILPYADGTFSVYIFFETDSDLAQARSQETTLLMRDFVLDNLAMFGRGDRGELRVDFEFDSFEEVRRNFEGSYFYRL